MTDLTHYDAAMPTIAERLDHRLSQLPTQCAQVVQRMIEELLTPAEPETSHLGNGETEAQCERASAALNRITAPSLKYGHEFVTRETSDFNHIAGLRLFNPFTAHS